MGLSVMFHCPCIASVCSPGWLDQVPIHNNQRSGESDQGTLKTSTDQVADAASEKPDMQGFCETRASEIPSEGPVFPS